MDPFLQVNDVLPGADGAKKSSMPKSEPKLSITELVSKARKQSKIEEQDNEDDERERRESNRQHDMLHDITAHEGHSHAVFCVAFHPEGRLLLSASGDKTVKLWDLQTHRVLTTFTEHEQWVYSVAFFHNTMAFATGCDDGRVRVYENKTDPINHETGWNLECDLGQGGKHDPANGHRAGVQSVDVSRDDAYVVSASADMTIKVRALTLTPTPLEPQAAAWPFVWGGGGEGVGGKTSAATPRRCCPPSLQHRAHRSPLAASPPHTRTHSPPPPPLQVWRKQEKECFLTLRGHADWVTRAIFDHDGLMVVSCSYDKHAKLWRLSDGEEQLTFYGHESWVSDVAFSPEGRSIATASGDFTVRIWQARGALTRRTTHAHTRRAAPAGRRTRRTARREHAWPEHAWPDRMHARVQVKEVHTKGDVQKEVLADGMPQMILYGHKNWVRLASSHNARERCTRTRTFLYLRTW